MRTARRHARQARCDVFSSLRSKRWKRPLRIPAARRDATWEFKGEEYMTIDMWAYHVQRETGLWGRIIPSWPTVIAIVLAVISANSAEAAVEKTLYAFSTMPPAGALQVGGNPT